MSQVRQSFIERMESELKANSDKGDWSQWKPDPFDAMGELYHHIFKLEKALAQDNKVEISEFSADIANIAMKISEVSGES